MPLSANGEEASNLVVKKCRNLWRRLKMFNSNSSRSKNNGSGEAQPQEKLTGEGEEGAGRYHFQPREERQQHQLNQSVPKSELQPIRPRRRLPTELLAELCDCVPHHRLGLAKLVTSYSSCPVGLFGVHLTAQNGMPSAHLFQICSLLTNLLKERREKMVVPISKWNENELELYNKWKAESVHLITLLEEVKRLHASQ